MKNKIKVIFICVGNSARSQMAEGFLKHYVEKLGLPVKVESAGTHPAGFIYPFAITVMKEKGIDISSHTSKGFNPEELPDYDFVINMGCTDDKLCPMNFAGVEENWDLPDPSGKSLDFFRNIRDVIESKVFELIGRIKTKLKGLYKTPFLTVDGIVEIHDQNIFKGIILIERKNFPYGYALPGGFVNYEESLENAILREIKEETNLDARIVEQFRAYSEPGRDPRFHTVTVVFILHAQGKPKASSDAKTVKVFSIQEIPFEKIVFDHAKIIKDYIEIYRKSRV